jgi:shikimate dehydrogenase
MTISAKTQVCAVIGDPVGHSLSPQIHNAAFRALGLDFTYVALNVKRGAAGEAVRAVRALGLRGLSVTIPHKMDVIAHLDAVEEVAQHIGSVNTIVNEDGCLRGSSTDGPGALRALAADGVDPSGRRILMLGSGGAARALAFTLAALDPRPELRILGIDARELDTLAGDLRQRTELPLHADALSEATLAAGMEEAEIVIHATPVGMTPKTDASLVPPGLIRPDQVMFDVVYTPLQTRLLRDATNAGARTVPGLGMFVHQAAIQFELWTGAPAPVEVMTKTVLAALGVGV